MRKDKLIKDDLVNLVSKHYNLSKSEAYSLVQDVIDQIVDTLSQGEPVLISSFGKFVVQKKVARPGRNPRTNEVVQIAPRNRVTFKSSGMLRKKVNAKD